MLRLTLAAALLLLGIMPASAMSGMDLYQLCASPQFERRMSCMEYVSAYFDALTAVETFTPGTLPRLCMAKNRPVLDGFLSWASRHQDELWRDAGTVLAAALFDEAGCASSTQIPSVRSAILPQSPR